MSTWFLGSLWVWSLIPILILKISNFQLPPKSDSFFIQLVLRSSIRLGPFQQYDDNFFFVFPNENDYKTFVKKISSLWTTFVIRPAYIIRVHPIFCFQLSKCFGFTHSKIIRHQLRLQPRPHQKLPGIRIVLDTP